MRCRRHFPLPWALLPILLLPGVALDAAGRGDQGSVAATDPDLAAVARGVPLGESLRLTGLELDGTPEASDLELERFRVFTPDARIVVDGSRDLSIPDNRYFAGLISGEPASRVLLTLRQSGELRGLIFRDGDIWSLAGGAGTGIVAPGLVSRRVQPDLALAGGTQGFRCGTDLLPPREGSSELFSSPSPGVITEPGADPTYAASVAIETDTEYLAAFGYNTIDATDYAGDLIAYSSIIYQLEVATSLQIKSLSLWSSSDPWQETGCGLARLEELKAYWQAEHWTLERTLVHMLSGKSAQCGSAWLGTLCEKEWGYGFSSGLNLGFNINNPGIGWDIMVVSHEIGHNFNSPHTNCYSGISNNNQQVDECTNLDCGWNPISYECFCGTPSLPCSGQSGCGTLMSYCHLLTGGISNIALTLGSGHPYGVAPWRVPMRMHDHVESRANSNPGCFSPLLTISKTGDGTGTVTSQPGGINCGSDCSEFYATDEVVNLTAIAGANSAFAGWSGDVDCSDGSVTMGWSKTCTATFNLVSRTLTITKNGSGGTVSSSPSGIDCGVDCQEAYPHGTPVALAVVPDPGWMLGGWSGDADCSDGELTMSGDRTCTVTFNPCNPSQNDLFGLDVSSELEFTACNILTAGAFRILDGGDVTFRAGNTIILKEGFEVYSGGSFRAVIGPPE